MKTVDLCFFYYPNQGTRKYGNEIEEVAFKESSEKYSRFKNETELYHEKEIYEMIGDHGKNNEKIIN